MEIVMKWKILALAAALWVPAVPALAADQSVDLSSGQASFLQTTPVLDGGNDVITFTGLASGSYNFLFSLSSQNIPDLAGDVNGQAAAVSGSGPFRFASLASVGDAPFVLTLTGTAGAGSLYSGEIQVTVVPEPATLGLLAIGLGIAAGTARRRARAEAR
jgi:hypothetical protein